MTLKQINKRMAEFIGTLLKEGAEPHQIMIELQMAAIEMRQLRDAPTRMANGRPR